MSVPRIAVCFRGQSRTFKACAKHLKQRFSELGNVDYFIHCWTSNSYGTVSQEPYEVLDEESLREQLTALWCPKSLVIGVTKDNTYNEKWYSIIKSLQLCCDYARGNEFEYDLVISSRLDLVIETSLLDPELNLFCEKNTFKAHGGLLVEDRKKVIDDMLWTMSFDIASSIGSSFFEPMERYYRIAQDQLYNFTVPLVLYLRSIKCTIDSFGIGGQIVPMRASCEALGLDPLKVSDREKIIDTFHTGNRLGTGFRGDVERLKKQLRKEKKL